MPPEPSSPGTAGAVAADTQTAALTAWPGESDRSTITTHFSFAAPVRSPELYAFVIDKLTERPEVADVRTSVIYEHLRNHAVAPARP